MSKIKSTGLGIAITNIRKRISKGNAMKVTMKLNGTNENPYEQLFGLKCNPFPRIAKYEWGHIDKMLADLAARPILDVDDLRDRMKGCEPGFIEGCCKRFRKGEMVSFDVTFPDGPFYRVETSDPVVDDQRMKGKS